MTLYVGVFAVVAGSVEAFVAHGSKFHGAIPGVVDQTAIFAEDHVATVAECNEAGRLINAYGNTVCHIDEVFTIALGSRVRGLGGGNY